MDEATRARIRAVYASLISAGHGECSVKIVAERFGVKPPTVYAILKRGD